MLEQTHSAGAGCAAQTADFAPELDGPRSFRSRWLSFVTAEIWPLMAPIEIHVPVLDLSRVMALGFAALGAVFTAVSLGMGGVADGEPITKLWFAVTGLLTTGVSLAVLVALSGWCIDVSDTHVTLRLPQFGAFLTLPPVRETLLARDDIAAVEHRTEIGYLLFSENVHRECISLVLKCGRRIVIGYADSTARPVSDAARHIAERYGIPFKRMSEARHESRIWPSRRGWPRWED